MKKIFTLVILTLSFTAFAQTDSIHVSSKKIKNKEVNYPVFSGISDIVKLNKIQQICNVNKIMERIGGGSVNEASLDFTVQYNRNYILDISFMSCAYGGSHPFCSGLNVVIDLKTGVELGFSSIFQQEKINDLLLLANSQMKADIAKALKELSNTEDGGCDLKSITEGATMTIENLKKFIITKTGITFENPMDASYSEKACIPEISPISFDKLKPYLKISLAN